MKMKLFWKWERGARGMQPNLLKRGLYSNDRSALKDRQIREGELVASTPELREMFFPKGSSA
jgi:hypothetical protein